MSVVTMTKKYQIRHLQVCCVFCFQAQKAPKPVFDQGSVQPTPLGELRHSPDPDPVVKLVDTFGVSKISLKYRLI